MWSQNTFLTSDFTILTSFRAAVAQLVEQLIRNQQVTGSSPVSGSSGKDEGGGMKDENGGA